MTGRKRIGALALCIGLIVILFVSTAFIIHEADHDCAGEDCPICRMIAVNLRLLRTVGFAALALSAFFFLLYIYAAYRRQGRHAGAYAGTLVSWKIRLND